MCLLKTSNGISMCNEPKSCDFFFKYFSQCLVYDDEFNRKDYSKCNLILNIEQWTCILLIAYSRISDSECYLVLFYHMKADWPKRNPNSKSNQAESVNLKCWWLMCSVYIYRKEQSSYVYLYLILHISIN